MPTRILREGIITSVSVNSLSERAELFYRRLMSVVDDYGRYFAHPALLRAGCFPLRLNAFSEADVQQLLSECLAAGLVIVYNGGQHLQLVKFGQQTRSKSKFPEPSGDELLSKCTSNDNQMCSESESESESYAYTGTASRNSHTNGKQAASEANSAEQLKTQLLQLMGTKRAGVVWPNAEEHLIVELVRRPNLNDELRELQAYKKRNPRYFPRSIEKLLYGWDKTLDESRQNVETANPSDGNDRFFQDIGPEQVKKFQQLSPQDQNSWRTNWEMNHG